MHGVDRMDDNSEVRISRLKKSTVATPTAGWGSSMRIKTTKTV